jgi:hypothetical protein
VNEVLPADDRKIILDWLRPILPAVLPGWTAGTRIAPGVTPAKFVLVKQIGSAEVQIPVDSFTIAFQFFGPDGVTDDYDRNRAARIVLAQARRLGARRQGIVALPDPTDPSRSITQATVTVLLRGEQQ